MSFETVEHHGNFSAVVVGESVREITEVRLVRNEALEVVRIENLTEEARCEILNLSEALLWLSVRASDSEIPATDSRCSPFAQPWYPNSGYVPQVPPFSQLGA
jgi:hypothetical protein